MNLHARESGECREQSAAYINELDEKRCGTYDRIVSSTGAVALVPRGQGDISGLRHTMNDVDAHDDMVHMPWVDESFMDATRLRHISRLWRQLVAPGARLRGEHRTIDDDDVCDILRLNHYILAPNRDLRDIVVVISWWKDCFGRWFAAHCSGGGICCSATGLWIRVRATVFGCLRVRVLTIPYVRVHPVRQFVTVPLIPILPNLR